MELFQQYETNEQAEMSGVRCVVGKTKDGKHEIAFILSRMGNTNTAYTKALRKATEPYSRQIANKTMSDEVADDLQMDVFTSTVLMGWEHVNDKEGKPLVFNKANAIALLKALPELYADLRGRATDVSLFRAADLEAETKN
jgi:hypothetical protein